MVFSDLMNDSVELRKTDGSTDSHLRASVQGSRIYMNAGRLPIGIGDIITRHLSTGVTEAYRVVDPGFYEAAHGLPAHYQMKVVRVESTTMAEEEISEERRSALFRQWEELGLSIVRQDLANGGHRYVGGPPSTRRLAMQWVKMKEREAEKPNVQVSGPNARVNINSTDRSTNVAVGGNVFASLREAIQRDVADAGERERLGPLVDALESAKDRTSFMSAYQKLIASAADHMTVLAPLLPALTNLLTNLGA